MTGFGGSAGTELKVKDVMTPYDEPIPPYATVRNAAEAMHDAGIAVLPVGTSKGIIGMVTDHDIASRALTQGADPEDTTVEEVMTIGVLACSAEDEVVEAIRLLQKRSAGQAIVLDGERRPAGVISLLDLARRVPFERFVEELGHQARARRER